MGECLKGQADRTQSRWDNGNLRQLAVAVGVSQV